MCTTKRVSNLFVTVSYRAWWELETFIAEVKQKVPDSHIVVVNSYFDDESLNKSRAIAQFEGCSFIAVENRGYGYGNNVGIQYALENYEFDRLVVCNTDVRINSYEVETISSSRVTAPVIRTLSGKRQNPLFACKCNFAEYLLYVGHKRHLHLAVFVGQAINKLIREAFLLWFVLKRCTTARVYAAHGSFFIVPSQVARAVFPFFSEEMFLYYEEAFFANRLKRLGYEIELNSSVDILHMEDGSTRGLSINLAPHAAESFVYYYEHRSDSL